MVKVEEGKGMKLLEETWREGGGMQVGAKRVEGRWRGGGKGEVEKQVEVSGKGGGRVVEAKLRGRILVKPREQMWMLQKVKVDTIPSLSMTMFDLVLMRSQLIKFKFSSTARAGSTRVNLAMSSGVR